MGAIKSRKNKGGKLIEKAVKTGRKILGKDQQKKRRNKGPAFWANKVLVEKLKKRYNRLKYGGAR